MNFEELRNSPEIKWTESPIVGLTMIMGGNHGLTDSHGDLIQHEKKYWVGKHTNGYLVIFPVETKMQRHFNDTLRLDGRLN